MHTVELLQEALETARGLGYDVRQDWLGGDGGGHCLVRGRRMLLLDVAQTPDEQLDVVVDALRGESNTRLAHDIARAGPSTGDAGGGVITAAPIDTASALRCRPPRTVEPSRRSVGPHPPGGESRCCSR